MQAPPVERSLPAWDQTPWTILIILYHLQCLELLRVLDSQAT